MLGDMKHDPNRNAKVIIPLDLAAWIGGMLVFIRDLRARGGIEVKGEPTMPMTVRVGFASLTLVVALAIAGCEAPVRSAEWDLMRNQPIHDAAPPGSTQLGRSTHPPRKVFVPGMGDNEGWFETVHASPLAPAQTHAWYAERFKERYRMSDNSRDGRFLLHGSLAVNMPIVITVAVSESRPQYGNILGRFPDGPTGTQSYVFIWTATH